MQNNSALNNEKPKKALALISGGLDSMLAAKLIMEQGIQVEGVNFFTGFCVEGHTHAIRKKANDKVKRNNALWVAETLGIKLHIIDIVEEYKDVVLNPKYGYGSHFNPCLDCKIFMLKRAYAFLKEENFDFIITGEVIGQRPKSQRKKYLPIVAQESGAQDLLLRPLSAKYLPPTTPELNGWVDREKLLGITGRSRKVQFDLAATHQISDYAQPAGGCCFLTDKSYSNKFDDLLKNRNERNYELDDIMLLKVGRHLRPAANFKLIIAREAGETNYLLGYCKTYPNIELVDLKGPLALIDGKLESNEDYEIAAKILARFSQNSENLPVKVRFNLPNVESKELTVVPFGNDDINPEWYLQ